MRAINHGLTGALIGLTVNQPELAVASSLVSHFVLDVFPHYGTASRTKDEKLKDLRSKSFALSLVADAVLCGLLVLLLMLKKPSNWLLACTCAFVAAAPDLFSIKRYVYAHHHKDFMPNAYEKFATNIQWFERPVGIYVEIFWFIGMSFLLWVSLH